MSDQEARLRLILEQAVEDFRRKGRPAYATTEADYQKALVDALNRSLIAAGVVPLEVLTEPRGARLFRLVRSEDVSGTSGVGIVAEGAEFSTGKVVLAWTTEFRSVAVYDSLAEMERIHGHDGRTIVEWSAGVHLGDEGLRAAAQAVVDQADPDDDPEGQYIDREALTDRLQEAILDLDSRQLMAEAQGYSSAEWRRWTAREIAEDLARQVARSEGPELDAETREYLAWAEADVPPGRDFADWHDKGTTLLRRLAAQENPEVSR